MVAIGDIRTLALALPGAYEQPSYEGRPSWRTKPRMFTWVRDDPEALVVWVESADEKLAMISAEPRKFFTTPHYDGHAIVLIRLDAIDPDEARELITESWFLRAPANLVRTWKSGIT
ncbi:MAG: MmcQ/YjbR family DNA-binding protein [Acidimicrobiales bacterium]